jgi:hypothetical protein
VGAIGPLLGRWSIAVAGGRAMLLVNAPIAAAACASAFALRDGQHRLPQRKPTRVPQMPQSALISLS